MSSPFQYKLTATISKKGQASMMRKMNIYAFKSGGSESPWFTGDVNNLDILENIIKPLKNFTDPDQMLTICMESYNASRLAGWDVDKFNMAVFDSRKRITTGNNGWFLQTAATIECRNLFAYKAISADKRVGQMCNNLGDAGTAPLVALGLLFGENPEGFTFNRNL